MFFPVRYIEEEIDSVRKSHKSPLRQPLGKDFDRELSLTKPEQNESRRRIIGSIVTDAPSPGIRTHYCILKNSIQLKGYIKYICTESILWIVL